MNERPVAYGLQKRIAAVMGRSRQTVNNWLSGRTRPNAHELRELQRWFPELKLPTPQERETNA